MKRNAIALSLRHRWALYAVIALLVLSGVAWAVLHYFFQTQNDFGSEIHPAETWMLKAHGAAAMVSLILLGTLIPLHIKRGWQSGRNRRSGGSILVLFVILTVTGYGLYYAGNEALRQWTSWIHLGFGLLLPVGLPLHIWLGRRSQNRSRHPQH